MLKTSWPTERETLAFKVKTLQLSHWVITRRHRIPRLWVDLYLASLPSLGATAGEPPRDETGSIKQATDIRTHPSSIIPSMNSFLVNSHWVAAWNFHATTSTVMLAGSSERSSQNCWMPSMPILFSSWGSVEKQCCVTFSIFKHGWYKTGTLSNTDVRKYQYAYMSQCCSEAVH